jgi:hypothetical protein
MICGALIVPGKIGSDLPDRVVPSLTLASKTETAPGQPGPPDRARVAGTPGARVKASAARRRTVARGRLRGRTDIEMRVGRVISKYRAAELSA